MIDFITVLSFLAPRKRRRLSDVMFGAAVSVPAPEFLNALLSELRADSAIDYSVPDFFAVETELDALYASAVVASRISGTGVIDDRRGLMEQDGLCLDAVFVFKAADGSIELVMAYAKPNGRWAGRRFRRLTDRLRRVFGDDGREFSGIRPRFVALGPDRPGPAETVTWPAWMHREDGFSLWLPYGKKTEELAIVRCDRKGRPRGIGEYWKLSGSPKKAAKS